MSRGRRFLSRILRHAPGEVGLTLGPGGWVPVEDLVRCLEAAGHCISHEHVVRIVADDDR
jgi:putative RNA 2'-phosphotransferase